MTSVWRPEQPGSGEKYATVHCRALAPCASSAGVRIDQSHTVSFVSVLRRVEGVSCQIIHIGRAFPQGRRQQYPAHVTALRQSVETLPAQLQHPAQTPLDKLHSRNLPSICGGVRRDLPFTSSRGVQSELATRTPPVQPSRRSQCSCKSFIARMVVALWNFSCKAAKKSGGWNIARRSRKLIYSICTRARLTNSISDSQSEKFVTA